MRAKARKVVLLRSRVTLLSARVMVLRAFRTRNLHFKQLFDGLFADPDFSFSPSFEPVCWGIAVFGIGG
jgi:hypothetical protein